MKKIIKVVVGLMAVIAIVVLGNSIRYNEPNQNQLILQFGKVIDTHEESGIFLTVPFVQGAKTIYIGENLYDLPASDVITSDKKTMIADCYTIWNVKDPLKFYQNVVSEAVAESRLNIAIYNSMKNVISSTPQTDVINGKDGSLGRTIRQNVRIEGQYGIEVSEVEMKLLDLPESNKQDVYSRMKSERSAIAAQYEAEGEKTYNTIVADVNSRVRQIRSNAEVEAAKTKAEGETRYYEILAESYSQSPERTEFYNYVIGLETLRESLQNGGVIKIDKNSPLYAILLNQGEQKVASPKVDDN